MSIADTESLMSAFATISLIAVIVAVALWFLAFGLRLAERRAAPASARARGRQADVGRLLSGLALDPSAFLFDRRLAAAAASGETEARRAARQSVVSTDGQVSLSLVSSSRREIEIALSTARQTPETIAVVSVTDEASDRRILIPLAADPDASASTTRSFGVALVPTTAQQVLISRDIKLIQVADLADYPDADIDLSVGAAVGPTRRWWEELTDTATTGLTRVPESTLATVVAALDRR